MIVTILGQWVDETLMNFRALLRLFQRFFRFYLHLFQGSFEVLFLKYFLDSLELFHSHFKLVLLDFKVVLRLVSMKV